MVKAFGFHPRLTAEFLLYLNLDSRQNRIMSFSTTSTLDSRIAGLQSENESTAPRRTELQGEDQIRSH